MLKLHIFKKSLILSTKQKTIHFITIYLKIKSKKDFFEIEFLFGLFGYIFLVNISTLK